MPPAPGSADSARDDSPSRSVPVRVADRREHQARVDRGDQRQEPAGGVGEPRDHAGLVRGGPLGDRVRRARRADRDDQLARLQAETEGGAHVVAGPGGQHGAARGLADDLVGLGDPGQARLVAERRRGDLGQPAAGRRGEVAGAGGVAAVGDGPGSACTAPARSLRGEPPGQPVVRQHDPGHPGRVLRLVRGQPAQLGHGERGAGHAPGVLRPPARAAQFGDQLPGRRGGAQVVPQQGGPDHLAGLVHHDHAVLLRRHRDRVGPVEQPLPGLLQRGPPRGRVTLGARRVRGAPPGHDRAVFGLAEQDLGRLRRRVHPSHEHRSPLRADGLNLSPGARSGDGPASSPALAGRVTSRAAGQPADELQPGDHQQHHHRDGPAADRGVQEADEPAGRWWRPGTPRSARTRTATRRSADRGPGPW